MAGDSAGGNLAATTAIACRDTGIGLAAQLLVYPVTDVAGNFAETKENARFPSRSENADGYFLTRATMEWFCGHYLADSAHGTDWRVSPLRAKNLAGVAPAIVATAWYDPLRDEGKAYADALAAAGVPTSYYDGLGLIHGYFGLGEASETAKREAQRARAEFRALLEKGVYRAVALFRPNDRPAHTINRHLIGKAGDVVQPHKFVPGWSGAAAPAGTSQAEEDVRGMLPKQAARSTPPESCRPLRPRSTA